MHGVDGCLAVETGEAFTTRAFQLTMCSGGSYSIYYALAVASKQLNLEHRSVSPCRAHF